MPTNHRGMRHTEGGWAENIDPTEANDRTKYMKKLDREPAYGFTPAVKETVAGAIKTHSQNNQIDLYEEFFTGEQPDHLSETISLKTLMIFKDPNNMKRAITKIKWHSDNSDVRVAVSYASLRFQQMPRGMPTNVTVSLTFVVLHLEPEQPQLPREDHFRALAPLLADFQHEELRYLDRRLL